MCTVADVTVTTRTKEDFTSTAYSFDKNGDIANTKATHHNIGTIITVENIFKILPVRRQHYNNNKRLKEEVKRIEELMIAYGLLHPRLRLTLKHNKNMIWRKHRTADYSYTFSQLFGSNVLENLKEIDIKEEGFSVKAFIPKPDCNVDVIGRAIGDRIFIFVNDRPVIIKKLKLVSVNIHFIKHSKVLTTSDKAPLQLHLIEKDVKSKHLRFPSCLSLLCYKLACHARAYSDPLLPSNIEGNTLFLKHGKF